MLPCGCLKHFCSESLSPSTVCQGNQNVVVNDDGSWDVDEAMRTHVNPEEAAAQLVTWENQRAAKQADIANNTLQQQVAGIDDNIAKFS